MRIATIQQQHATTCYFHEVLQPDNLVFRMLPYLSTQRDVHSTTVKGVIEATPGTRHSNPWCFAACLSKFACRLFTVLIYWRICPPIRFPHFPQQQKKLVLLKLILLHKYTFLFHILMQMIFDAILLSYIK